MGLVTVKSPVSDDVILVQLAREVAMEISELETILKRYEITSDEWTTISQSNRFHSLLQSSIAEWHSATNTAQRIQIKSASMMELWLEEAYRILNDKTENLPAKVELAKLVSSFAGIGRHAANASDQGSGITITINLGADKFEKTVTSKVIEHDPTPKEQ
jgi:hypothetical protein